MKSARAKGFVALVAAAVLAAACSNGTEAPSADTTDVEATTEIDAEAEAQANAASDGGEAGTASSAPENEAGAETVRDIALGACERSHIFDEGFRDCACTADRVSTLISENPERELAIFGDLDFGADFYGGNGFFDGCVKFEAFSDASAASCQEFNDSLSGDLDCGCVAKHHTDWLQESMGDLGYAVIMNRDYQDAVFKARTSPACKK